MSLKAREIASPQFAVGPSKVERLFEDERGLSEKLPKTLYLRSENFKTFEKFCKKNGRSPSQVVDVLIDEFLDTFTR